MNQSIQFKIFGSVLSDGSFRFMPLASFNSQYTLKVKRVDIINHSVWTGRRPKQQTEISAFIGRLKK